ncbi:hypothetical protein [Microlunatus sp. Y2014]|uniref:hypothetical protein n=1 Tax=Microlunatus sp. Y2014 TaxID=3418488 RepID=UPI003DA73F88
MTTTSATTSTPARSYDWEGRIAFEDCSTESRYRWTDLPTFETYGPRIYQGRMIGLVPCDAERDNLPFPVTPLTAHQCTLEHIGGLLMWNKTLNEEGGTLVMFAGQTTEQERTVLSNAGWWTSCGLTYSETRSSHFRAPDDELTIDGQVWHITYLDNNRQVGG